MVGIEFINGKIWDYLYSEEIHANVFWSDKYDNSFWEKSLHLADEVKRITYIKGVIGKHNETD